MRDGGWVVSGRETLAPSIGTDRPGNQTAVALGRRVIARDEISAIAAMLRAVRHGLIVHSGLVEHVIVSLRRNDRCSANNRQ